LAGVTAIHTSCTGTTVEVVEPVTELKAAEIVVLPADALVARPELLIMATPVEEELHVTELVRFCVFSLL
jgi:hypothetical protein